jgi:hypothetical protein
MIRILLIEDDERRYAKLSAWMPDHAKLVWAKDAGAAIGVLERLQPGDYAGIMLDHDLDKRLRTEGSRFLCGSDIVGAMLRNPRVKNIPVLVHSMNPTGSASMEERLTRAGFVVTKARFSDLTEGEFVEWVEEIREDFESR